MFGSGSVPYRVFGIALAVEGNLLVVGSPGRDSFRGGIYLFDLAAHLEIGFIQPVASAAGVRAGLGVALQQGIAAIGAPTWTGSVGRVYLANIIDGAEKTLTRSDGVAGEFGGMNLALNEGMLLVGSPYLNSGKDGSAYLYDVRSAATTELRKVEPAGAHDGYFGTGVAWSGNTAVISERQDDDQASNAGALHLLRPVTMPAPGSPP